MQASSPMNKIAQITLVFWIMKISATTLGETAGDLLAQTLGVGYAVSTLIFFSIFLITLVAQLSSRRYIPALYWTVILSTSVAGTTMSDFMDRTLALGYAKGSMILITILLSIFAYWYFSERSLNINYIRNRKAEVLYWIAILFSNTLGTALGDFLSRYVWPWVHRWSYFNRQLTSIHRYMYLLYKDFSCIFILGSICFNSPFRSNIWRSFDKAT